MADNLTVTPGSGATIGAESIVVSGATTLIQRVKLSLGTYDTDTGDLASNNPMPITGSTTVIGTVTITGSTSVINTVTVTGSTTIVGTATITGSTTLVGTSTITGSTSVVNTVTITGSTSISLSTSFGTATINSTTAGTGILIASTATNSIYVTSLLISNGLSSGTVYLGQGATATAPTGAAILIQPLYFAPNGGCVYPIPANTPLKLTASNNFIFTIASTGTMSLFATYYVAP